MSLLSHLSSVKDHLQVLQPIIPRNITISTTTTQKIVIVSLGAGLILVGALAKYLRRKKRTYDPTKYKRSYLSSKRSRASGIRSPNDLVSMASSGGRRSYKRQSSTIVSTSEKASMIPSGGSLASGSGIVEAAIDDGVAGGDSNAGPLTPQQLGVMGMEALEACIRCWEDALAIYRMKDRGGGSDGREVAVLLSQAETDFCRDIQLLLDSAIDLQESSEMLFLDERSILFRSENNAVREQRQQQQQHLQTNGFDTDTSGRESFASAQDQMVADLKDFEEFTDYFPDLDEYYPLYQSALRHLENGGIPYRTLRTELVKCGSDGEYLSKLHCLRLAFQQLLRDSGNYVWFVDAGRQILADLMLYADRDPKDFLIAYEEILQYIQDPLSNNWRDLEEELSTRGVKALTFYDVVLDYILMDAFEDLECPPSSVLAVIQNRWLSNSFKETALTTAVWSVLKAKRRRLKFSNGFMAHFYTISEQLCPLLAWGFLGSDESLRDTCIYFKEQVIGFLGDIFNFQKCRFVNVDTLACDVLACLKIRVENISQRLRIQH